MSCWYLVGIEAAAHRQQQGDALGGGIGDQAGHLLARLEQGGLGSQHGDLVGQAVLVAFLGQGEGIGGAVQRGLLVGALGRPGFSPAVMASAVCFIAFSTAPL